LATVNPKIADEWNYVKNGKLTPKDIVGCSGKSIWWKCKKCNSEWIAKVSDRKNGTDCPYCSNHKLNNTNCLAVVNPALASEWNYAKNDKLTPQDIICGGNKKVWWKCKNGHEWRATIENRNRGSGCPDCGKIELKDGAICDSLPEAYYYLQLKGQNIKFNYHARIGLGKSICDFYVPISNKYIEVTGYNKMWKYWDVYHKNILKKQDHIIQKLKAKFEFIQIKLLPDQIKYVRENSI
jgi:DNA-directed RNA polymerase subunit RPC12/RpoP